MVNTSSYTVRENMSILRAYDLFRTMGCRHMVVVDISNHVVGMLTRNTLVDVCHPPHDIHHDSGHGGHGSHGAPHDAHSANGAVPPMSGNGHEALLPR